LGFFAAPGAEIQMTIQEQLAWDQVDDETLSYFKAIGVDYLTIYPTPESLSDGKDRLQDWLRYRDRAESSGLVLRNVATKGWDALTLGLDDRDQKIDAWCMLLRNLGEAGIPTLGYNFKPIGNFRTKSDIGRGGVRYSTFDYDELMKTRHDVPEKAIEESRLWENMVLFLERVLPVAESCGVVMALHPDDPPIPELLGGAARIVSTLDHYHRIFGAVESDSNAMLFCQGCVSEMGVDVFDAIEDIGGRGKICYVHFRDIQGSPKRFREVFVDEGQTDMRKAMETYKSVGFDGPFMMDHTPSFPQEKAAWVGRAYAVGYMRAMIQTVYG
jgi:mannonate dehydratase